MKAFEFHQPKTLDQASGLLIELGEGALVYAGGTDIIPRTKLKKLAPEHLINIKGIPNLKKIEVDGSTITIGALSDFNEIMFSEVLRQSIPILPEVASTVASHQVRNLATIGGNLCNAAPSADSAPVLLTLGARVRIFSKDGEREMPLEDFFKGPGNVDLKQGEILTQIMFEKPHPTVGHAYIKHKIRASLEIAIAGLAVSLDVQDGVCRDARIAAGACAPVPMRCLEAEAILSGTKLEPEIIDKAAVRAAEEVSPIDDVRSSAEYRRKMIAVNLKRAVEIAKGKVMG